MVKYLLDGKQYDAELELATDTEPQMLLVDLGRKDGEKIRVTGAEQNASGVFYGGVVPEGILDPNSPNFKFGPEPTEAEEK